MPSTSSEQPEKPRADPALKWGISPGKYPPTDTKPEEDYSPEEQAEREKLRKKGINPDLKAEMDEKVKNNKSGGFWNKVAGTTMGGGSIK